MNAARDTIARDRLRRWGWPDTSELRAFAAEPAPPPYPGLVHVPADAACNFDIDSIDFEHERHDRREWLDRLFHC